MVESTGSTANLKLPTPKRGTVEVCVALACAVFGAIVIAESLTHDIGWNETGPGSGYFPFRVGLLMVGAAAGLVLQAMRSTTGVAFVTREESARASSVFLPTMALVASMLVLGCYVPSAAYLAWMMRRHGGRGWLRSAVYGATVMVAFFVVFDVWFKVPLAKGPVEAALGLY